MLMLKYGTDGGFKVLIETLWNVNAVTNNGKVWEQ